MKLIALFLRQSRTALILSVTAGMFSGLCNAGLLAIINLALNKKGSETTLIWIFASLCVLLPFARFTSEFLLSRVGQQATYELRMQLCRQILSSRLRHVEEIGAARLMASLNDDVATLAAAVGAIPLLWVNASLVVGCLIYMGVLSPVLLLIVLGFVLLGIGSYQLPIIKVHKLFELARRDTTRLHAHFRALIQGNKELKLHASRRNAFLSEELEATADSMRRHNVAAESLYAATASWGQTLVIVVIGMLIFLAPSIHQFSSRVMVSYAIALLYFMTPLQIVLNTLPRLTRAKIALSNTEALGLELSKQSDGQIASPAQQLRPWSTLRFHSVTHRYRREAESGDFILGPLNLTIESGELLFIVGGNGSGKTTLVKLLTGLYLPEDGYISLDDERIGDAKRESYRQYFSAVFADFFLFERMLGLNDPKLDVQAAEYLEQLKLSRVVGVAQGKLSTTDLSQGQRKRLALLTAYLEDRPIYIFDEWAADQDPHFKAFFYTQLLPELKNKGKTVIVISHDDRYYEIADRLIKLEDGQVVSDNTRVMKLSLEPISL